MKPRRLAYLINSVEGGGAALPVPAIAAVLREAGASVRVFALAKRDGRALPAIAAAGLDPAVRAGGLHDHAAALRWLRAEVTGWGATHLVTSLSRATILGLLLGPRLGLPVLAWQHNAYLKPANRWLLRALQHRAALWVCDSESVTALTRQRLAVEDARLACWPIFAADATQPIAAPWRPGDTLQLGSLGRLHPAKGYDVLIAALARLRAQGFTPPTPYALTLAGEGGERERLAALARHAQVPLVLPGFVDAPKAFLAGLHLYLQPSRREGFCIAAHEAMVAGLPVVASAVGELPHSIAEGRTGHVLPPGDVGALAQCLAGLLRAPERLQALGAAARTRTLEHFSAARFRAAGLAVMTRFLSCAG